MPTKIANCVWWLLWMCYLSNAFAASISTDAPFVTMSSPSKSFEKGKSAIIEVRFCKSCNISCNHNGKSLPSTVKLRNALDHLSVLEISHLEVYHTGSYNCMASDGVRTANASYPLFVPVPPTWTMKPANSTAVLGSQHEIPCIVEGYPKPSIKWWKVTDNKDIPLDTNDNFVISANSTKLVIKEVRLQDFGEYKCSVDNGIGETTQASAYLTIIFPPTFVPPKINQKIKIGEGHDTILEYPFHGKTEIYPTIEHNGGKLDLASGKSKIELTVSSQCHGICVLQIKIPNATLQDSGIYKVILQNRAGVAATHFVLDVIAKPKTPTKPTAAPQNVIATLLGLSLSVTWTTPPTIQGMINGYRVIVEPVPLLANRHRQTVNVGLVNLAKFENLLQATTYRVTVFAYNEAGDGPASDYVTITTSSLTTSQATPMPEARVNITVEKISLQSITLSWGSDLRENTPIFVYIIYYKKGDGEWMEKVLTNPDQRQCTIQRLECNTEYEIRLEAVKRTGELAYSSELAARTAENENLPAINLTKILSGDSQQVLLDMRKLELDKCQRINTDVQYRVVGENEWGKGQHQGHSTTSGADLIAFSPRELGRHEIQVSISNASNRMTRRFMIEVQTNSVKELTDKPKKDIPGWIIIIIILAVVVCFSIPLVIGAVKATEREMDLEMDAEAGQEHAEERLQVNGVVLPPPPPPPPSPIHPPPPPSPPTPPPPPPPSLPPAQPHPSRQHHHPQPRRLQSTTHPSPKQHHPQPQLSPPQPHLSPPQPQLHSEQLEKATQTIPSVHFCSTVEVYGDDPDKVQHSNSPQL